MKRHSISAWALAALLGISAVNHLRNPTFYYPVVPPPLCSDEAGKWGLMTRHQWVLASSIPEALAAAGLLLPSTRRVAATATALMFASFTAGHVSALRRACAPDGTASARRVHTIRLPLQVPLVIWAWSIRRL